MFSIIINKYTESENRSLAKAAFVFEIFLTVALVINATFSISVQRKMSVARMGETNQKETIEQIGKLKGSRTQREALKKIDKQEKSSQSLFENYEDILFWIMAGELALYAISAFTLFAIAKLLDGSRAETSGSSVQYRGERGYVYLPDGRKRVTHSSYDPDEVGKIVDADYEFPSSLDTESRSPLPRERLETAPTNSQRKKKPERSIASFDSAEYAEGLKALREVLKDISFRLHGFSFQGHTQT